MKSGLIKRCLAFCGILLCLSSFSAEKQTGFPDFDLPSVSAKRKVEGSQVSLWTPVSEIEDGAVYMIRSVDNPNLYWDLTGGYLTNGTEVQLYPVNYSHAQKFIFKRQFSLGGEMSYRLAPLFAYDKVLSFTTDSNGSTLKIADEEYVSDNDYYLFRDKFCFLKDYWNPMQFTIATCIGNSFYHRITVDSIAQGQKIKRGDTHNYSFVSRKWEIIKTDYLGLNVGNKVYANGVSETRLVARAPFVGEYVLETHTYPGENVDTYLRLVRDSDSVQVAYDDDGGEGGYNAKITYNFTTIEEFSVFLRGYDSSERGYCYLVFRPAKTIYMTGTYDIDNQHCDRISAVNQAKTHLRNLGCFPVVFANIEHETVFADDDWEQSTKMDRDYYLFYGHGNSDGSHVAYFDRSVVDWAYSSELPTLNNAGLVVWMTCHGGNYIPSNPQMCMAYASVMRGADYSLGFAGDIYNLTADKFIPKFFEALNSHSIQDSMSIASSYAIQANYFWWYFGDGQNLCDIDNPILFSSLGYPPETINCGEPRNIEGKMTDYVKDCGFVRNTRSNFQNIDQLRLNVEPAVSLLKENWDDVGLYLGGNESCPRPLAICTNRAACCFEYIDLLSMDTMSAELFNELMGLEQNENVHGF